MELSFDEEATYRKLCDFYYLMKAYLPDDDRKNALFVKLSTRRFRIIKRSLVEKNKIWTDGEWLSVAHRPPFRRPIPKSIRDDVRATTNNHCTYCGCEMTDGKNNDLDQFTVDHIVPFSVGGSDRIDNLAPACRSCNSSKGAKY